MPTDLKLSVTKFVQASAKYVDANLKKIDLNRDGKVSAAEAKALPKDLRDNFESFRAKKSGTGAVSVKEFAASFKSYVSTTAKKADADKDGFLKQADTKKLPVDLRDNFLNFYKATEAQAVGTRGTPMTVTAKVTYVPSNECDNQPTLQLEVKLPTGKTVTVEVRNPAWRSWDAVEKLDGKTLKLKGHVVLNKDLRDIAVLADGNSDEIDEADAAWNVLYKDTTHSLEFNSTEGIFVVDSLTTVQ
ncbi:MAG: hypothetical protein JNG84_09735 [Archangium sp.]|nr:hypothetical protein [Archangium sp.]